MNTHYARDMVKWKEIAGRHSNVSRDYEKLEVSQEKLPCVHSGTSYFLELAWPSLSVLFCFGLISSILLVHWVRSLTSLEAPVKPTHQPTSPLHALFE